MPPDDLTFRQVYENHGPMVRKILFRLCGPEDLDDLVQETFVKVYKSLDSFEARSSLSTWVFRIAVNSARDFQRSRGRRNWLKFLGLEKTPDISDSRSPMDQLEASPLRKAIEGLSPKLREVVVLHSIEDLEVKAIGEMLGIPEGTVKSRLSQAREKLREALEES